MRAGFYTDLEFDDLLKQTAAFCVTEQGQAIVRALVWQNKPAKVLEALNFTNEYVASFSNNNRIPNHGFEPVDAALKLLEIPNSALEIEQILRLKSIAVSINEHLKFFEKFNAYYPNLSKRLSDFVYDDSIAVFLNQYLNRFGEIKDDASGGLFSIRQQLKTIKSKINQAFGQALQHYDSLGYLDEIRESSMHDRRVLAVIATYKKKVKGQVMSTSKGGSIIYIEPEHSARLQNDFFNLQQEEREEIRTILKAITSFLRDYLSFFHQAIDYLSQTDAIAAKARFCEQIEACLPEISKDEIRLINAFHPLLLLSNTKKKLPTFPQDIALHDAQRIIVISGPNAGGKSITLKTVGLLQVMLQTGFLVPVHPHSKMRIFNKILTDIGDNQSIENQLSTYSYRLKNMRFFLKNADDESLFLIDEFGTGSDPELGGALAEAMLEEFYAQKTTGIITTHYTNLKMLADSLPHMINATMLFDPQNLSPEYKLQIGEAGSSFTFEVAYKMGIPYRLINKAKKKIQRSKLRFDQSIAKL
ncbi:MAG: DNA mismatch repair protein MutS, partial [Flavobacteriaceae bacterium]|nr:DNA mismatch repair protein MutS [Flavobacteriaceae bacterium]